MIMTLVFQILRNEYRSMAGARSIGADDTDGDDDTSAPSSDDSEHNNNHDVTRRTDDSCKHRSKPHAEVGARYLCHGALGYCFIQTHKLFAY